MTTDLMSQIDRAHQLQLDIRFQAALEPDRLVRQHLDDAAFLLQGVQDHLSIAEAGAAAHQHALGLQQQIALKAVADVWAHL